MNERQIKGGEGGRKTYVATLEKQTKKEKEERKREEGGAVRGTGDVKCAEVGKEGRKINIEILYGTEKRGKEVREKQVRREETGGTLRRNGHIAGEGKANWREIKVEIDKYRKQQTRSRKGEERGRKEEGKGGRKPDRKGGKKGKGKQNEEK